MQFIKSLLNEVFREDSLFTEVSIWYLFANLNNEFISRKIKIYIDDNSTNRLLITVTSVANPIILYLYRVV